MGLCFFGYFFPGCVWQAVRLWALPSLGGAAGPSTALCPAMTSTTHPALPILVTCSTRNGTFQPAPRYRTSPGPSRWWG